MGRVDRQKQGATAPRNGLRNWIFITAVALGSGITGLSIAQSAQEVRELLEWGDNDMALERAEQGLEKTPDDAELQFYHALALARTGETDDAIDAFKELAEAYPNRPEVHNNLAVLYAKEGDYEEARAALEAALATHEAYATAHKNLGDIYSAQAADAYNRALARDEQRKTPKPELSLLSSWQTSDKSATLAGTSQSKATAKSSPVKTAALKKEAPPKEKKVEPAPKPEAKEIAKAKPEPKPEAAAEKTAEDKPTMSLAEVAAAAKAAGAKVAYRDATEEPQKPAASKKPAPAKQAEAEKPTTKKVAAAEPAKPEAAEKPPVPMIAPEHAQQAAQAVENWAAAWREQNAAGYVSAYADFFRPENGLSHKAWKAQRETRISSPKYIRVALKNLRIRLKTESRAVATFQQDYQSDSYQDSVKKTLYLENIKGNWKIVREVSK